MYIKSITIDGFKSYGKRTEIKGFDPEFNAITGLNGTGKSNVLDSICFVLGISNLTQVRATSLQDLVYKSGQAGVRQASVCIVFDNRNKAQSPIGFEGKDEICITRQVVIGGKNKYLLNGRVVLNNRIQDLFASVKLNINNPNFLIMQGRVTKVLNMKPLEILSMIEEAVGSKMFDQKMLKSMQIFQKKSEKLVEFQTHLNETIKPRLAKLEKDKIVFLEYQRISKEIDYLTRIHVSYMYLQLKEYAGQYEKKIEDLQNGVNKNRGTISENEDLIKAILEEISQMEAKISGETKTELHQLEGELKEFETQEAKTVAKKNIITNEIKTETKNLKVLEKTLNEDKKTHEKRVQGMKGEEEVYNKFQELIDEDTKEFELAQKNFEAVSCGLEVNEDGQASSLLEQLMKAKQQASEENTTIKQCEMELKNLRKLLQTKKSEKHSKDSTYLKEKTNLERIQTELDQLKNAISKIQYEDGSLENLEHRRETLRMDIQRLQHELDNQNSYRYDFKYRTPEPNFDHSRVKGRVCKLFKVKDMKFCTALETCAGGSLYSVVTDTDVTSKLILQKGDLQSRTTMIPMNKIKSYTLDQRVIRKARDIGGNQCVFPALSLIEYDPELENVMRFIFGTTFICTDMNVAKKVTYHKEIMTRSVTLDGDVLDPEGSLSGGAAAKGGSILVHLADIAKIEGFYHSKQAELVEVEQQIGPLRGVAHNYNKMKDKIDVLEGKQKTVQMALGNTTFEQNQVEVLTFETEIETLEEKYKNSTKIRDEATKKVKEVEQKIAESKQGKEQKLKSVEQRVKQAKKKLEDDKKTWKKKKEEFDVMKMEVDDLAESIAKAEKDKEVIIASIAEKEEKLKEVEDHLGGGTEKVSELKQQIQQKKEELKHKNKELNGKHKRKDELTDQIQELNLVIKKSEIEVNKIRNENADSENQLKNLEKNYTWIEEDRQHFGKKNTQYDYTKENPEAANKKLASLLNDQKRISLNINQNVLHLLKQEEEQHAKVLKHIEEIETDKTSIQEFLEKNEKEKWIQVEKACKEVNKNFSEIFSTILPGVQAMLKTVDGDFRQGLDIKVGFGGIWKESLSELSGGQRSLVALSLILAMLKYNPAPIYILDEVDAALDLSHTQNIGKMLKIHFKDSQFIIVSLKDGMFNNANVLFRTQLTEGISGITRTTNKS